MDKILLTAFLSALAGFITAILSIVKLINDKESKTTDYRQAWTESARSSLAKLIGLINSQTSNLVNEEKARQNLLGTFRIDPEEGKEKNLDRVSDVNQTRLISLRDTITECWKDIHETYALTRLHFKPNDLAFNRIEQKYDIIISLMSEIQEKNEKAKQLEIKEKINSHAKEMTDFARDILKTEWETVKNGEPAYKKTKQWSIWASVIMLFVLLSIGIHAYFAIKNPQPSIKPEQINQNRTS